MGRLSSRGPSGLLLGRDHIATMSSFDPAILRTQFPALAQHVKGRPAVFLDARRHAGAPARHQRGVGIPRLFERQHPRRVRDQQENRKDARQRPRRGGGLAWLLSRRDGLRPNMTSLTFAVSRAIGREIEPG